MTDLPSHLSREEFLEIVEENETLLEVSRKVRLGRDDTKALVWRFGLESEVKIVRAADGVGVKKVKLSHANY